jgi:AraC-like DNA-binding protein
MRPCVRAASLDGWLPLARSLRLDTVALTRAVGLDLADLAAPEKWIPAAAAARLLELSADRSGREAFGLLLAGHRRLSTLGPLSVVLREQPDLRSALGLLVSHERSYNEALRLRVEEDDGVVTVRLWTEFGEPVPTRQVLELAVAALLGIIRELLGTAWEPLSVSFSHRRPEVLDTHLATFGPRLRFDQPFTGLLLPAAQLDTPNAVSDPLLRPYAQRFLELLPSPRGATVSDRVRQVVEALVPVGRCSTLQVARSLGVTQRTLHRHLAEEGETFSGIVNATRAALAERYLANERYSLTDVSQLLGFTAPSTFSRWFRAQFGVTPSHWRESARGRQPVG